ncbi:hypothetical protein [Gulosibacter sp. 10]|uniref:hypothetical protein n=1 Tax=Gulosibacter sp. 10 TaxID=1255570 RepID=UPI00097EDFF2|nr:hypothetical protein [Gulosibacter sp. 10]SJM57444.1 hypothetical protein FM112_05290 [Gulosibacter sp. 10]
MSDADLEYALTERAWSDPRFATLLRTEPATALLELGVRVPAGVRLDIRVQRRDTLYFAIPPMPDAETRAACPDGFIPNQMDLWRSADQFCWLLPEGLKMDLLGMRQAHRRAQASGPIPPVQRSSAASDAPEPDAESARLARGPSTPPPARTTHDPAEHYRLLTSDPAARARLIEDPVAELRWYFGYMPEGDYRVEIVDQRHDTIAVLLPVVPPAEHRADALEALSGRIFDILFTTGVGGYCIPDDRLKWVLRDMRSAWIARIQPERV